MKDGAWSRAYRRAWATLYSIENMNKVLDEVHPDRYWDVLRNFYWYKSSALNEGAHPMITGFFRIKDRRSRRPSFPREGVFRHARRRIPEIYRYVRGAVRLTLEFEELWLQTRKRSETEMRVHQELARMREDLSRSLRVSELRTAYLRAKSALPGVEVPSRLRLWTAKLSVLHASRLRETRSDLHAFWDRLRARRAGALLRLDRIALNALREVRITAGFFVALAAGNRLPSAGR
jgi:hypothetical protein